MYAETRLFPDEERFGLTNQIRRAAVPISSNIAEGCAWPDPDFARFLTYASGSLYEAVTQATIAHRQHFLTEDAYRKIYADAEEISRMLTGLRDSLTG